MGVILEVKKAENPIIVKYLKPFFIEDSFYTKDIIAKEIFNMMVKVPREIFVAIIFEKDLLHGFIIGWLEKDNNFIWITQAWSKPGTDRKYGRKAINMIKEWAVNNFNIHEMRFETNRNPKAIERVWGFKIHSYIMKDKF